MKEFESVIGYESIKLELKRVCDMFCNPDKYERLGVSLPGGIMMVGAPGLGKTTMAKAFIKESGKKAFVIRKEKPDGSFVNYIRECFEKAVKEAEKEPCIVFLDDLDKFSNEDNVHCNSEEFVTIQSCMDKAKGSSVMVIATANKIDSMPDSLLRAGRFDKIISIESPTRADAEKIIDYYLKKKSYIAEDVDAKELAGILKGKSCAELESCINEAGIYAAFDNREMISMNDIIHACLRIIYDAPIVGDEDENPYLSYIIAHECGHAVVNEYFNPGSVNLISVARNDSNIGGLTSHAQNEFYFYDKKEMEHRVISVLAGKAATELAGISDTGCNNDINRAFNIVSRFVDDYSCYGFSYRETYSSSPDLLTRKEIVIQHEVERFFLKAKEILIENKYFFDRLSAELKKKKVLLAKDIQHIKKSC